jgi:methylmalonyl-CoA mutase
MTNLFDKFNKISKEEWTKQIEKDLKGKSLDLMNIYDNIEELSYSTYYSSEDISSKNVQPGNYPYLRGINSTDNDWSNCFFIEVTDESTANKKALSVLMKGCDSLYLKSEKSQIDWVTVLNGIEHEFINLHFELNNFDDFEIINSIINKHNRRHSFNFDFIEQPNDQQFETLTNSLKKHQQRVFKINGFGAQQIGANTWQEIGFCLNAGHEILLKLMEKGLSIDEAAACLNFQIGIGANYFLEIAKIRSFRTLWAKVVDAYSPNLSSSYNLKIIAISGHLNKSVVDPHTNLLRQTTEAMAAVSAGIDDLLILPHDQYSSKGVSELAERMALNISSILKEESYFDKVIDPLGGSYSIEELSKIIGEKAWTFFQELESKEGLFSIDCLTYFKSKILAKRDQRIELFESKKITGIGINKYQSSEFKNEANWTSLPLYLDVPFFNYEVSTLIGNNK